MLPPRLSRRPQSWRVTSAAMAPYAQSSSASLVDATWNRRFFETSKSVPASHCQHSSSERRAEKRRRVATEETHSLETSVECWQRRERWSGIVGKENVKFVDSSNTGHQPVLRRKMKTSSGGSEARDRRLVESAMANAGLWWSRRRKMMTTQSGSEGRTLVSSADFSSSTMSCEGTSCCCGTHCSFVECAAGCLPGARGTCARAQWISAEHYSLRDEGGACPSGALQARHTHTHTQRIAGSCSICIPSTSNNFERGAMSQNYPCCAEQCHVAKLPLLCRTMSATGDITNKALAKKRLSQHL